MTTMSKRAKPNRQLAVDPAFADMFRIDFHATKKGGVDLNIRDDSQGGVIFRFQERVTAERFCDYLIDRVEREFAPETPGIWARLKAALSDWSAVR